MEKKISYGERGLLSMQLFHIYIKKEILATVSPVSFASTPQGMLPPAPITQPLALPQATNQLMSTK